MRRDLIRAWRDEARAARARTTIIETKKIAEVTSIPPPSVVLVSIAVSPHLPPIPRALHPEQAWVRLPVTAISGSQVLSHADDSRELGHRVRGVAGNKGPTLRTKLDPAKYLVGSFDHDIAIETRSTGQSAPSDLSALMPSTHHK